MSEKNQKQQAQSATATLPPPADPVTAVKELCDAYGEHTISRLLFRGGPLETGAKLCENALLLDVLAKEREPAKVLAKLQVLKADWERESHKARHSFWGK